MTAIKKLTTLLLALMVVLMFGFTSLPAMAADGHTVTIQKATNDKATTHSYEAYKIFSGKLETVGSQKVLSDISWGNGIDTTKLGDLATALNALKSTESPEFTDLTATSTAKEFADAIGKLQAADDSAKAQSIAAAIGNAISSTTSGTGSNTGVSGLDDGYYFIKDKKDSLTDKEGAYTRYILRVLGEDLTVAEKANVPTVEKKVKEKNDTTGSETGWQDAADYDIGDAIPYEITGTLPSTFADYKTYKTYTFTDTLSEGLTITDAEKAAIKVTVGTTDVTSHFDIAVNGQVLTVSLKSGEDLKTWTDPALTADSKIVVTYSATLNDKAKIGSEGNPNTVNLTYSNNPNDGDHGKTPDDKVTVFTYEIQAKKVGEDGKTPLEGAGFTLYKKGPAAEGSTEPTWTKVGNEITGVTTFEFKGADAGEYKLVETTVPAGYNKAEDITFTVTAAYDTRSADPKLTSLTVTPADAHFTVTTTTSEDGKSITTDGVATTTIQNQKGSLLPSTGGMGTTLFYIVGGLIVVIAAGVLISRRRKSR